VTVGETIADDNPEIKQDMYEACKEARVAGEYDTLPARCWILRDAVGVGGARARESRGG